MAVAHGACHTVWLGQQKVDATLPVAAHWPAVHGQNIRARINLLANRRDHAINGYTARRDHVFGTAARCDSGVSKCLLDADALVFIVTHRRGATPPRRRAVAAR